VESFAATQLHYILTSGEFMDKEKENNEKDLRAVWIDPEVHDLLWVYKVKHKKKSIGEVAGHFIKLGICNEETA
jgi:hypothetical protein